MAIVTHGLVREFVLWQIVIFPALGLVEASVLETVSLLSALLIGLISF
jgi:hypothetical protein